MMTDAELSNYTLTHDTHGDTVKAHTQRVLTFAEARGAADDAFAKPGNDWITGLTYRVAFPWEHVARLVEMYRDGTYATVDNPW